MAAPAISIRNLDHLGLVAALCQELGIARMIDALLPKTPPFKVSHGEALVAMIVNGLGFHSSTLHMFPQFFANKPVERLDKCLRAKSLRYSLRWQRVRSR